MASKKSRVAAQLVRALALRLNIKQSCPITSKTHSRISPLGHLGVFRKLLTLFNSRFPLPHQASWTVFKFDTGVITRVISTLQMKGITLAEWQRLPTIERHIVQIGSDMSDLWDWTLTHRGCSTRPKCVSSPGSPPESDKDSTAGESASRLGQSLALSRPLDRRLRWLVAPTQPRSQGANGSYHDSPKSSMDSARRTHQQPNNCQSRQTSPNS
jgi:hypothetical protein